MMGFQQAVRATALALALVAAGALSAAAAPGEVYRTVKSVHWAVRDLDAVKAGWAKLGFPALQDLGAIDVEGSWHGQWGRSRVRLAMARFAGVDVVWVQPLGENAFSEYLARHGDGVFSLNYEAPSREALEAEVARLSGLGVGVLQRAEVTLPSGTVSIVHMDTEPQGKYVIGLVHGMPPADSSAKAGSPAPAPTGPPFPARLSQYALVVESLQPVSEYWARLGFPVMEVTHPPLRDLRYHGEPGRFDQKLGWHRHGTVTFEWIEPLSGPTVYRDFLKTHGEGFHHFAFDVPDIDAAGRAWTTLGAPVVQSGGWGEPGKPGSGRFAYADTTAFGGVTIELLWSQP